MRGEVEVPEQPFLRVASWLASLILAATDPHTKTKAPVPARLCLLGEPLREILLVCLARVQLCILTCLVLRNPLRLKALNTQTLHLDSTVLIGLNLQGLRR